MSRITRIVSTVAAAAAVGSALAPIAATAAATPGLTFAYLRDGNVYVGTGTATHQLTTDGRSSRPRWSPDGRRIAYLSGTSLWVMNADGTGKHRLGASATGGPSWSPDSRWVACVGPDCNGHPD